MNQILFAAALAGILVSAVSEPARSRAQEAAQRTGSVDHDRRAATLVVPKTWQYWSSTQ